MHDPVEGGRAQQLVVEGVVPFREVQIAGDDRRPIFVAIFGGIDDEQIYLGQCRVLELENFFALR